MIGFPAIIPQVNGEKIDKNRRAVGMLTPLGDKKNGHVPGWGRKDNLESSS